MIKAPKDKGAIPLFPEMPEDGLSGDFQNVEPIEIPNALHCPRCHYVFSEEDVKSSANAADLLDDPSVDPFDLL